MKRSIPFRPTLLALVLATNFPFAHAAVPKDMPTRLISGWFSTKRTVIKAQPTLKAIWQVAGKRLTIKKSGRSP